ncbi:type I-E CRISPR-associated protein Cse1/CasA [Actinoalloteichus caeruleus]|uniref:type I-E CRISPR-associated protein Cse1/CasA n=1 Tax=Actinoalloteichus cyanogriseus TaxID=2893586 RepID=UPI0004A9E4DD|nr:type I-E CRISPR-associated protein Cse1/CasA [Actinoalloteichus caeruleus]
MSLPDPYDLVERPWLLVRDLDGEVTEKSLLDTLTQSETLAGLVGDIPTQQFAHLRLLLAVCHRAFGRGLDDDGWKRLWDEGVPQDQIKDYLERHRSRFDLFHPVEPFMQVATLRTAKDEVFELNRIVADVPNGHPFFSTRLERDLTLSPAEAARWLVHCHAFDPSGIKSGAVGDSRVKNGKGYPIGTGWSGRLGGVAPEGDTLWRTLLLNLVLPTRENDLPAWEHGQRGPLGKEREPTGPVDLYTWQSRRIRLVGTGDRVTKVLVCNGDPLGPQNQHRHETHTSWRRSETQEKKLKSSTPVYMPLEHSPERVIWRGLTAMLPQTVTSNQRSEASDRLAPGVLDQIARLTSDRRLPRDYPLRLHTTGMTYGSQSSTTAEIVDDAISLHAALLDRELAHLKEVVLGCVRDAEKAAYAVGDLALNLAKACGSREEPNVNNRLGPKDSALELAYAALDPAFRRWLAARLPGDDPIDVKEQWHVAARAEMRAVGSRLIAEAPPTGWTGRLVKDKWLTIPVAERWFTFALNRALPMASPAQPPEKDEE